MILRYVPFKIILPLLYLLLAAAGVSFACGETPTRSLCYKCPLDNRWVSFQSKMAKLIWTISILLLGLVPVARGQETPSGGLSNVDKTAIIEAVLKLESRHQTSLVYGGGRRVSSENIEFIEPSRVSNHGFRYLPAKDIVVLKKDQLLEYLRFNQIFLRDGVAVVTLSRVTEGRACFAESFSSEKGYTYEARPTAVGWIAELTQSPASPLSFPPISFSRKVFPRR